MESTLARCAAAALVASLSTIACGPTTTAPTVTIRSITIEGIVPSLGNSNDLKAIRSFSDGFSEDVTSVAIWQSSNPAVASVVAGRFTALAIGQTDITACYQGVIGSRTVTTYCGASLSIQMPSEMVVGMTTTISTKAALAPYPMIEEAFPAYSSSRPEVAAVTRGSDARGVLKAIAPGQTTIRAVQGCAQTERLLTVIANP